MGKFVAKFKETGSVLDESNRSVCDNAMTTEVLGTAKPSEISAPRGYETGISKFSLHSVLKTKLVAFLQTENA